VLSVTPGSAAVAVLANNIPARAKLAAHAGTLLRPDRSLHERAKRTNGANKDAQNFIIENLPRKTDRHGARISAHYADGSNSTKIAARNSQTNKKPLNSARFLRS
jgi:hypothetical protein